MTPYITKSHIMTGLRCPKQLWLQTYNPELAQAASTSRKAISNGVEIGVIARQCYQTGRLVGHVQRPDLAVAETARLINEDGDVPLFEGAFTYAGTLIRADILIPDVDDWRIVEVKSSGSVKKHHLADCAIQLWVAEGAGLPISKISIAHVNTGFVYAGDGDYEGLLVEEDMTEQVRALLPEVPAWLALHRDTLAGNIPSVAMGAQCKPECAFESLCKMDMPDYPVAILPNGRKLIDELIEAGIEDVRDIPDGRLRNERHIMVRQATLSQRAHIADELRQELAQLPYPRFYLDFETINFVIPRWAGTRPHQQLPFQWSCHIERDGCSLEHIEFLSTSGEPPMRKFAESLIKAVELDGPIIVYGSFESTIIKGLMEFFPDLAPNLIELLDRLVNLLSLLQSYYYHPDMKGSWSIKAVLPTIAAHLDYKQLEEVQNGTMAQQAYLEIIAPATPADVKARKVRNLLKYCESDTQAMVEVVQFFSQCR